ncbi:histidine kinase dimerization/phospho-acceptor domain-containing protein [Nocardioides sp. MH1]|uniref:HAMP domain-containing sensor histidine kinase n=1 Tax=Nocardioides sp. MH1 TaxID=3242490 RepID=UPI0035223953
MSARLSRVASFRAQLVGLTTAVTAALVLALTIVVQLVLAASTNHSLDTVLADRAEAVISSASAGADGRLVVPQEHLDAGVAVYDAHGRVVAGSAPSSERTTYARLATTDRVRTIAEDGAEESRVRAEPFRTGDGASGVVVVSERLAPYERGERQALLVCVGAGAVMIALAAGLAQWVSRRALAPVAAMTRSADDWSEHDLTHRFDLGPGGNEIAALGRTLDRLLERVAHAIRSEQRLTSELAHELRTPLAVIQANADLLLLRRDGLAPELVEQLDEIAGSTRRMAAVIRSLLELARTASSEALTGLCSLRDAVAEAASSTQGGVVDVNVDETVRVALPEALAVRAITPVLDNARRLAGRTVVSSKPAGRAGFVDLLVDDDGPGIPTGDRDLVFDAGRTTGDGAGLGLPLARRIARSMGGDVRVAEGPLSTRIVVTLPTA